MKESPWEDDICYPGRTGIFPYLDQVQLVLFMIGIEEKTEDVIRMIILAGLKIHKITNRQYNNCNSRESA